MNKNTKDTRKIYRKKNKTIRNKKNIKMNCNPTVKNKTISSNTCYTKNALIQLKEQYNKHHSDKITATTSKKIWNSLRQKLDHCSKEDCWLDEIKEPKLRQQLDDILFSPDRPNSWDKNPVSWLSNYDIGAVLKQYETAYPEFKLLGPSAIDYDVKPQGENDKCVWNDLCRLSLQNLYNRGKRKLGIVFNLDKHDEPGSHWVSLFVDLDESLIFYYDSAMNAVPRQVSKLKREIIKQGKNLETPIHFKYMQNEYSHQNTNTECGMYCLFFNITFLTKHLELQDNELMIGGKKKLSTNDVIKIFTKPGINDNLMIDYRNKYFNKK
jgi:hypothetical protein|tara:strand:+ start:652 stop:1623 length:972 start_codon:yes stop_codon:yes gene_type:complete